MRAPSLAVAALLAGAPALHAQPVTVPTDLDTIPVMPLPPPDPVDALGVARDALRQAQDRLMDVGPLRLALGPTGDGAVGAVMHGRDRVAIPGLDGATLVSEGIGLSIDSGGHLEYSVDGAWVGAIASTDVASFSLRPGLDLVLAHWAEDSGARSDRLSPEERQACRDRFDEFISGSGTSAPGCALYRPPVYFMSVTAYADLRYRYANLDVAGARVQVNQSMLGGGVELFVPIVTRWTVLREFPRIAAAYYTVPGAETSALELPGELEADFVAVTGRIRLNVPLFRRVSTTARGSAIEDYPLQIHGTVDGTRLVSGPVRAWDVYWTVQMVYEMGGLITPVLSYRAGAEAGLEYDRQWLLGVAWPLSG